jgi:hypothetical protein
MSSTVRMRDRKEVMRLSMKQEGVVIGGCSYISTGVLAGRLSVSPKTIWRWQSRGILPPFIKVGRLRLYREDHLAAWLAGRETT